jgi:hypothetical protein
MVYFLIGFFLKWSKIYRFKETNKENDKFNEKWNNIFVVIFFLNNKQVKYHMLYLVKI